MYLYPNGSIRTIGDHGYAFVIIFIYIEIQNPYKNMLVHLYTVEQERGNVYMVHSFVFLCSPSRKPFALQFIAHIVLQQHRHISNRLGRYDGITVYKGIYKYRRYDFQYR